MVSKTCHALSKKNAEQLAAHDALSKVSALPKSAAEEKSASTRVAAICAKNGWAFPVYEKLGDAPCRGKVVLKGNEGMTYEAPGEAETHSQARKKALAALLETISAFE